MSSLATRSILTVLLVCLLPAVLWAADPAGAIAGGVSDPSGAAIVGAKVVATNINTGLARDVTTAADGGYLFPLLPVGFYSINVQAPGFERYEQRGIEVKTDQSTSYPGAQSVSANGARTDMVNYNLDGGSNEDPYTNVNNPFPNPDALEEFSVQTNSYSAEYGRGLGSDCERCHAIWNESIARFGL